MNRKTLAAALVLVASAGSALADDITIDTNPFSSTQSRAAVQAQVQQFRASVNPWAQDYNPLQSFTSGKTRAQVTAEYIQSRGVVAATTGEDSGAAFLAQRAPAAAAPVVAGQPVNAQ